MAAGLTAELEAGTLRSCANLAPGQVGRELRH